MHLAMLGNQDYSRGSLRRSQKPRGRAPALREVSAGFPEQYLDQTLGGDEDSAPGPAPAQSFSAGPAALEQRVPCAAETVCFPIRFTAEKRPFTHRRLSRSRTSHPWNRLCGESIVSRV